MAKKIQRAEAILCLLAAGSVGIQAMSPVIRPIAFASLWAMLVPCVLISFLGHVIAKRKAAANLTDPTLKRYKDWRALALAAEVMLFGLIVGQILVGDQVARIIGGAWMLYAAYSHFCAWDMETRARLVVVRNDVTIGLVAHSASIMWLDYQGEGLWSGSIYPVIALLLLAAALHHWGPRYKVAPRVTAR